jgi:hypothetical protein
MPPCDLHGICAVRPRPTAAVERARLRVAFHDVSTCFTLEGAPPDVARIRAPFRLAFAPREDVEGGVLLHLDSSAPPPEEAQNLMRCHRAWMAHEASNSMPRCPIGSPGIVITSRAGAAGTDLSLVASKPEDVTEIRKRTHAALSK